MKTLVIDEFHPDALAWLSQEGWEYVLFTGKSHQDLLQEIGKYEGVLIRSGYKIDKEIIDAGIQLRFIARAGAGMENIDTAYAVSRNIHCFNSPEGNRDAVGEHAIGMLLMLLNHLKRADQEVRKGTWNRKVNWGTEIMGKTVGIIGYGNTGSAFARKLSGFGCEILAYDAYKTGFGDAFVKEVSLETLFERVDIISLHLPLTPETLYYADVSFFTRFKKPVVFINTSRGKILHTEALVNALQSGSVTGACLDVLEYEGLGFEKMDMDQIPVPLQYLQKSERVIFSPHIAGWTHESFRKISLYLVQKVTRFFGENKKQDAES